MSDPTTRPILVLGAYGEAGEAVVGGLVYHGLNVLAAGRRPDRLERLRAAYPDIETLALDVCNTDALASAIRAAGLVINCVGPYIGTGFEIAQAAVRQGRSVIDLASEQEHHRRLQVLAAECAHRGVTVLTGAGAYPGVSGLLLEAMLAEHPGATAGQIALITGPPAESGRGAAQVLSGLSELAHNHSTLEGGQLVAVRPGHHQRFVFPEPFGDRVLMSWPQLEVLEAASAGQLPSLSTFVALSGRAPPPQWLLRAAGWLHTTPGSWAWWLLGRVLPILQPSPSPDDPTTNHGAILVRLEDDGVVYETAVLARELPAATAWLPVFAATQWASGSWKGGVVAAPMRVFDPAMVAAKLRDHEHITIIRWNEALGGRPAVSGTPSAPGQPTRPQETP